MPTCHAYVEREHSLLVHANMIFASHLVFHFSAQGSYPQVFEACCRINGLYHYLVMLFLCYLRETDLQLLNFSRFFFQDVPLSFLSRQEHHMQYFLLRLAHNVVSNIIIILPIFLFEQINSNSKGFCLFVFLFRLK